METPNKTLFIDVETSGVNAILNAVLSISILVDINGEVVETFDRKVKPFKDDIIEDQALEVNGFTRSQIYQFEDPIKVQWDLLKMLEKYVEKFNKEDFFTVVSYNDPFDSNMIIELLKKSRDDEPEQELFRIIDEAIIGGSRDVDKIRVLNGWYQKHKYIYFSTYAKARIDAYNLFNIYKWKHNIHCGSKLSNACNALGVQLNKHHDSLCDVMACRDIFYILMNKMELKK